jgi:hypothetical protein
MEDAFHSQFYRTEPEIGISDLARIYQESGESAESFIFRFKEQKTRCQAILPEKEYVKMAINGRPIEFQIK